MYPCPSTECVLGAVEKLCVFVGVFVMAHPSQVRGAVRQTMGVTYGRSWTQKERMLAIDVEFCGLVLCVAAAVFDSWRP